MNILRKQVPFNISPDFEACKIQTAGTFVSPIFDASCASPPKELTRGNVSKAIPLTAINLLGDIGTSQFFLLCLKVSLRRMRQPDTQRVRHDDPVLPGKHVPALPLQAADLPSPSPGNSHCLGSGLQDNDGLCHSDHSTQECLILIYTSLDHRPWELCTPVTSLATYPGRVPQNRNTK